MLSLNIKRMLRLRGVGHHYHFLLGLGFAASTARKMLNDEDFEIKLMQLEKLCVALNCTPNDLLEWQPETSQAVSETHSMNKLKRSADKDLTKLLNQMPPETLEKMLGILQNPQDNSD